MPDRVLRHASEGMSAMSGANGAIPLVWAAKQGVNPR